MAYNSDTTQFVKTYGKPRRTQRLGQDSLWVNDLVDEFDKCLGIEDDQKITFISPEPVGSHTLFTHKKEFPKKNKMKTVNKCPKRFHSTLMNSKSCSTAKNKTVQHNFSHKSKNLLASVNKKTIKSHNSYSQVIYPQYTSMQNTLHSDIFEDFKGTPKMKKKRKNQLILSKEQCSTPLQRSVLFISKNKSNKGSSKKKKMKKKLNKHNMVFPDISKYAELSKKIDYSHLNNSSGSTTGLNDKYGAFDQSVQISGSHFLKPPSFNKKLGLKDDCFQGESFNDCDKFLKPVLSTTNTSSSIIKKRITSCSTKEKKNSGWYNKLFNVLCDEKSNFSDKSYNESHSEENITALEKSMTNSSFESVIICNEAKTLEQQRQTSSSLSTKNESFQSIKNVNHNSTIKEDSYSVLNVTKSNKCNFDVESAKDSKVLHDDSSCTSFTKSSNNNITVDDEYIQNRVELLPLNNSCGLAEDDLIESITDHLDTENLSTLQQSKNIGSDTVVNFDHTFFSAVENISVQSNNTSASNTSNSKHENTVNVTNISSNILLESVEQNVLKKSDESLCLSFDKSKLKYNTDSNRSLSTTQSLSSSDEDTVIYNTKCPDICSKENTIPNSSFLNEIDIELNSPNKYSKKDIVRLNTSDDDDKNSFILRETVSDYASYCSSPKFFDRKCHPNSLHFNHSSEVEVQPEYQSKSQFEEVENTVIEFDNLSAINYEESKDTCILKNISNTFCNSLETSDLNVFKNVTQRRRYANRFQNSFEKSVYEDEVQQNIKKFHLEPSKKWRRSIIIVRSFFDGYLDQTTNDATKGRKWISTVDDVLRRQSINTSFHQRQNQSHSFKNSMCRFTQRFSLENSTAVNELAKKNIFELCNQQKPMLFKTWFEQKSKKKWTKIGEGVYGEVFKSTFRKSSSVVKIIPVEGENYINSERQKIMSEVFSEIQIVTELNKLFDKNSWNQTNSFCKLKSISCVQGKYPEHLIMHWKKYNSDKGSDNDNPDILPSDQMFLILEMEDCGIDVENFVFNSAYQASYAFLQIIFGLAVAEQQYSFEHRDLHIGNILVKKVGANSIFFTLDGEEIKVASCGVKITIIDFTLSRITHVNKPVYNDLAKDPELFLADGDYQFEIYRLMREEVNNKWDSYKPKTNIYWLHYVLDKMLTSIHYRNNTTKIHNTGMKILTKLKNVILSFDSAKSLVESDIILELLK